jgi:hypothetical protein
MNITILYHGMRKGILSLLKRLMSFQNKLYLGILNTIILLALLDRYYKINIKYYYYKAQYV